MSITGGGGEGGGKGSDDFRPRRDLTGTKENYLSRTGREGDWNTTELQSYTATEPHRGSGKFYCQPTFLRTPLPPPATLIFNPSDKRLISHHSITSETNIKVTEIEEIIANSRHFRL